MTKKSVTSKKNFKKGQSSVEYILIIAAVVGVVMLFGGKFKEGLGSITSKLFGNVGGSIDQLTK